MKKVINIFGGPGCGKSTTAAGLFWLMKQSGMSVELVNEYAKECVFEDRSRLLKEDQLYIFTKQHRKLYRIKDQYDYIIMDSPLVLSSLYIPEDGFYDVDIFNKLVFSTFNKYPNINFFIPLNIQHKFENTGRMHDFEQSSALQAELVNLLYNNNIHYHLYNNDQHIIHNIFNYIKRFE